jgi:hypothetical protein
MKRITLALTFVFLSQAFLIQAFLGKTWAQAPAPAPAASQAPPANAPAAGVAKTPAAAPTPSPYSRQATLTESAEKVQITANSPRPLAQVLDVLLQKYKWVVGYEDPQFTAQTDLVTLPGVEAHVLPNGGMFTVEFSATAPGAAPDEEKTLRAIVDAYNQSKNPGRFELHKTAGGVFYVAGTAAHDDKGAVAPQKPILDSPVTVAEEQRSVGESLNLMCQDLSTRTHTTVMIGVSPRSPLQNNVAKIGAKDGVARDFMLQALAKLPKPTYWRLLFDPASKEYYLDLHYVHFQ